MEYVVFGRVSRRAVWVAVACGFFASCVAIVHAPLSVFPRIELARVEVFADAAGLPAESVRAAAAEPLASAFATLPGARATRTFAGTGRVEVEIDFDAATNAADDRRDVERAVDDLRGRLPISNVAVVLEGPEAEPVVSYAVVSRSRAQDELLQDVRAAAGSRFIGTPQLGRLTIFGGPHETYEVTLDAARLAHFGVTATGVAHAIAAANGPHGAGTIERKGERLRVVAGATLHDLGNLADLGIDVRGGKSVPLTMLGDVGLASVPSDTQVSFDAEHAVILNAYATSGGDAVALARAVAVRMASLATALPGDAHVSVAWDQTRLIASSQQALRLELLVGAAIALLVIGVFLRSFALTAVATIVLPVALAFPVAALVAAGLRLDLMTLGGLAIAIGLIIDEIIVVVEAIARARETAPGDDASAAIADARRRIARPLIASTIANIVVFLPLTLLGGVSGAFFRALAITLALALAISIVFSLTLAPALAQILRLRGRVAETSRMPNRPYAALIRFAGRRPVVVILAIVVIAAASAFALARTPSDFLPVVDEGQFEVSYSLPPGTSLGDADRLATMFERTILLDTTVAHVARLSGVDTNGYLITPPDAGTIRVTLKDGAKGRFDVIADRTRERLLSFDPSAAFEIHQLLEDQINDLSGAPEAIAISVFGPDQATLTSVASRIADAIVPVPGVVDVFDGVTYESRSIRATPRDLAPVSADFANDLAASIGGIHASDMQSDAGPVPIDVHIARDRPLEHIAHLGEPEVTSAVSEENGARFVRVTAEYESTDLSATGAQIQARIASIVASLPVGYRVDIGGTLGAQRTAFVTFAKIFVIAFVLLLVVLLVTFDSFRLSLVVLAAVPAMPAGVALALFVSKTTLNVASFMGMLLLTGLVVRGGILLVDSARRHSRAGAAPTEAMLAATHERLRPILMTTCATLGAVAPLALGIGAGAEFERPLAIAVIGGMVSATAMTLVVVPALYIAAMRRTT